MVIRGIVALWLGAYLFGAKAWAMSAAFFLSLKFAGPLAKDVFKHIGPDLNDSCGTNSDNRQRSKGDLDVRTGKKRPWRDVLVRYLPIQNRLKITPNKSSEENAPVMLDNCSCASRNSSANRSSDWSFCAACAAAMSM